MSFFNLSQNTLLLQLQTGNHMFFDFLLQQLP